MVTYTNYLNLGVCVVLRYYIGNHDNTAIGVRNECFCFISYHVRLKRSSFLLLYPIQILLKLVVSREFMYSIEIFAGMLLCAHVLSHHT